MAETVARRSEAQLNIPRDIAVDGAGNLYIADSRKLHRAPGG